MELKATANKHLKQVLRKTHIIFYRHLQTGISNAVTSHLKGQRTSFPSGEQSAPLTLVIPGQRVKISQQAFERQIMHFINTV